MNFSRFLDIQAWWEVPSIAYFCSLFRTAFNLLDFDIEELEEALLTDGTEESASSLLTELIVRLLNGCLGNNDISAFNYQMYLRRLFRRKCQDTGRCNPFDSDIDFQFLPLRTKVEILYALCDFRLDASDVFELFKNLEAESLRVDPLGWDDNDCAYWYFYGTRLYREDVIKPKAKNKKKQKKPRENKKRGWFYGSDWLDDDSTERVWQVVCFTADDWKHLTEKFRKATSKVEKELYRSLSQNFLPEIPRLFLEKERLQRKRLLESAPRRTSSRVLQKIKQKEEESKQSSTSSKEEDYQRESSDVARQKRALRRSLLRHKSTSSDSSDSDSEEAVEEVKEEQEEDKEEEKEEKEEEEEEKEKEEDKDKKEDTEEEVAEEEEEDQEEKEEEVKVKDEMPQKASKRSRSANKRSKNSVASEKGEPPPPVLKRGRKTNNSLAAATGQIVIPDNDEPVNSTRKKLKTSQIFSQTEEDIQTDMYKVLEQLSTHEDAWPFMDPVEEEYAPNYYAVIRRPMDLRKMEERLDSGYYTDFSMFKGDFKLIVNNCRLYNGQDNEYTLMVDKLQAAFDRLTEKYMHRLSSSDEEIAVEYQLPTPSRKHKLKPSESPTRHKRKKRKSNSDAAEPKSSSSDVLQDEVEKEETESKTPKESHKNKEKKKRKGHHRHGKHSKTHKKQSRKHSHGGSSKSKHNKKHGKKSKQKKKKNKHHEPEPEEVEKRSATPESIESSNRSRSASPLPSIHTPSPSPTELDKTEKIDQLSDPDFYKDKYDKIKERRRHTAKETWESLFDFKQKAVDKQKQNVSPEKNKNQKLRETIEKLRAKNEKYKSTSLFNSLFGVGHKSSDSKPTSKVRDTNHNDNVDLDEESEQEETHKEETNKDKAAKKSGKKSTAKNESASEALEQAVKDISKWLNDAPKGSAGSTPCDSPTQTISTEEHDNSRLDDELSQSEKSVVPKKDTSRKRPSSREPKLLKRREIQRTIDRLQPGKSKGNLLTNVSNKNSEKVEEITSLGPLNKPRDVGKGEELSPKLSLGSVLPTVKFTLGNDHNFGNNEGNKVEETKDNSETSAVPDNKQDEISNKINIEQPTTCLSKKDAEVETEPQIITKPSQEKATPNLSAWFKAFGAPKSNSTGNIKKKAEDCDVEDKVTENSNVNVEKSTSPKNTAKYDSPVDPDTPNPDEGDSPLPNVSTTPRQRRTSTGSSVSERSSFSQDLDSPRHQMSHTSPLLRSPASPRTDDFQKITYPIINGTVRAGFYQDTTSVKSSPEKSCSPREAPQSPYSPYSQHVYASNNVTGSATPNYFVDHNKSPLPTYGQNSTPYYDMSRNMTHKARIQDDYGALTSDTLPNNQYSGPFSPIQSAYQQPHSNYPQNRESPQPPLDIATPPANPIQNISEPKTAPFPVKKRIYNEPESTSVSLKKVPETKERSMGNQNKVDYPKIMQSPCQSLSATSVDDIALALSEKTEINNKIREKPTSDIIDRHIRETRDNIAYDHAEIVHNIKKDARKGDLNKSVGIVGRDNVDMVNMGYMNPENDRRNSGEVHDIDYSIRRDMQNMNPQQNVALNLGINHQMHKTGLKPTTNPANISLSHTHDRSHADTNTKYGVQNMVHAHHNQYEALPGSQSHGKFSLNDIELANKKLFACNTPNAAAAIDYGNWKMTNQMRKQDVLPSDYSNSYSNNSAEKLKSDLNSPTAYKNLQHPYTNYNVPRSNMQRSQDLQQNLSSELRIPNPRGLLKTDHMASHAAETDLANKNMDTLTKTQKVDKHTQNHPLVNTNPYKTSYSTHSSIPLESLRNIPNIPQILERYTNEERYLSSFAGSAQSLYHDKTYQMAQMFTKSMASEVLPTSTSVSLYSQPLPAMNKESSIYKTSAISSTTQNDSKAKNKRKKATETKQTPTIASQGYHASTCASDVLTSVKSSMMSASPFNFGAPTNMTLTGGLYGDNGGFSIEDIRNSNQLMAANYMAAAVAHQQRSNVEVNSDKLAKPAHQNSAHTSSSFPFMGHSQVRSSYPFVGADPTSPLYQQYLQRHQAEELLRQTGAQIMELYSPGYPTSLGVRQPYDPIIRPSWL